MTELKENQALRQDMKKAILSKFSGFTIGGGKHLRVYLEDAVADYELMSPAEPGQTANAGPKGIVRPVSSRAGT